MGYGRIAVTVTVLASCGGERPSPGASLPDEANDEPRNVLLGPGSATHPAVSPDGVRLAFLSNAPGVSHDRAINFEIFVSSISGGAPARLTENDAFDADIAWSPDGRRIAFKSSRDGNDEIYLMADDGSGQENLTRTPSAEWAPDWSPDGSLIAFSSDRNGSPDLFVMAADGSGVRSVAPTSSSDSSPRWSPDGRRIAFVSDRAGNDDIWVMDRDGSHARRLTSRADADWYPRWSPDGTTLSFISGDFESDRWSLFAIEVEGQAEPRRLLDDVDSGNASWSPDGTRLFFGRYVDGESRLFSIRPDGSDLRPVPER